MTLPDFTPLRPERIGTLRTVNVYVPAFRLRSVVLRLIAFLKPDP